MPNKINSRRFVRRSQVVKQVVEMARAVESFQIARGLRLKPGSELKLESAHHLEAGMF